MRFPKIGSAVLRSSTRAHQLPCGNLIRGKIVLPCHDSFNEGPSRRPQQDPAQTRIATGRLAGGQSRRTTHCPDATKSSFAKGTYLFGIRSLDCPF